MLPEDDKPFEPGRKVWWFEHEVEVVSSTPCGSIFSEDPDDFIYVVRNNDMELTVSGHFLRRTKDEQPRWVRPENGTK